MSITINLRELIDFNQVQAVHFQKAADILTLALNLRQPTDGCIFHSDRGSQYCACDCQKKLQTHGLRPSMSDKGNCYDNASVKTFFKSLKAELIWR